MNSVTLDRDLISEITARLDLREPNSEALESIAIEISQHYDVDGKPKPLEGVVDVATGVGKTYIMASAIEYLTAARGVRNFAVVTPGRTILRKTQDNFTPGTPKSLTSAMSVRPVVITSENFATAAIRATMDDPDQIKLFIFTVQALTKPQTEASRRTHKFQEGLGAAFYEHLRTLPDLVVFADEHHTYYGEAFSKAIRDLSPHALLGLTATPHKKTPSEQILYRYPLAAAIAEQLVKTPVIVGRQDDRADPATKLLDGIRLLELKRMAIERYCAQTGKEPINPVMLVIAKTIDDAKECRHILEDPSFAGGAYKHHTLEIHSNAPDEALEKLDGVEDPNSPVRIIVSVGMLKEGWDVKNVYVIASLRASVSDILTEQTLGRGLRLPFGAYTNIEILDSLEVLAHERYEDLLRRSQILNEAFIDQRTRAVLRTNALGQLVASHETTQVGSPIDLTAMEQSDSQAGPPSLMSTEQRVRQVETELDMVTELYPRDDMAPLRIPRLVMHDIKTNFSLADITEHGPFRQLGERIAADPNGQLRRTAVSARIVTSKDGLRRTELVTSTGVDSVYSRPTLLSLEAAVEDLRQRLLAASIVPSRKGERQAAEPIIQAFVKGLGNAAEAVLSGYLDRAAAELIRLVTAEQRKFLTKPSFQELVEIQTFAPIRRARATVSRDRYGAFSRTIGYAGWKKSMYAQAWFDSNPERGVANMLDDAPEITCWVRLQQDDLPILWSGAGNWYHPDLVAIDTDRTHWIIEVKADRDLASSDVQAKKEAAKRWASHVSANTEVNAQWRYLLVSESQIDIAKGSWIALRHLAE